MTVREAGCPHVEGDPAAGPVTVATPAEGRRHVEELPGYPPGCRWQRRPPEDQPEPAPGRPVVWEYLYPEQDLRGSTGYQVRWQRGESAAQTEACGGAAFDWTFAPICYAWVDSR